MKPYDVLIVGAGIVGCACALRVRSGGFACRLIEGYLAGGGATAAGMGHIVVMDDSPAQLDLTATPARSGSRIPKLPDAVEYETRGTIWVAADDEEMAEVHAKRSTYARCGRSRRGSDAAEVASRNRTSAPRAWPEACWYPAMESSILRLQPIGFYQRGLALGADDLPGLRQSPPSKGEVRLSRWHDACVAERIVLAIGTDCDLLPALPIQKRKGHLLITDRYPGLSSPSTRRARLSEERAQGRGRLRCVQHPAASDRATPDRLFAPVRQRGARDQKPTFSAGCSSVHGATCRSWRRLRAARLDGLPRCNSRQAAPHRPGRRPLRGPVSVARRRL